MRILALLLACQVAFTLGAADITSEDLHGNRTNGPVKLVPGPNDPLIAKVTGRMLERQHYLRKPFTAEVGSKFLDRYLDSLDNFHIYFLQSDLDEFEAYRSKLNQLTLREGDTSPARVIFTRFRERLQQQYDYVTNLLHTEQFTFEGNDRYNLNRKTAPRPADIDEARRLWRERLRYEYLQERLGIGQPEVIGKLVLEKLQANKPKEVRKALTDKVSKEKADDIVKLVNEKFPAQKPEEVVKAITDKLNKDNSAEIVKIISRRYTRVLRFLQDYDNDDVLQVYLTALAHIYDPHSDYMGKNELENFSIGMKLSLFGIGALLRSEDGICKIQELKPGPAERSGKLKNNDKIIAVAQGEGEPVDVVDMPLKKVVELIRGPKGTEVRLTVIPADAPDSSVRKVVPLLREEIKLEDQEAKAKLYEIPNGNKGTARLGVIDLPSFYSSFELEGRRGEGEPKSTTTDVARLIKKLVQEGASGIVLDLRKNGGGSLEEAINLTGLFINGGPVVQVRDSDDTIRKYNGPSTNAFYNGPLIVLTSRFSASASEILAGALQDYGRAVIVGDVSTHGKGTVQSLIQLAPVLRGIAGLNPTNNPGAIKITIRKFYRASGSSTQKRGVIPDLVLPSLANEYEVGESSLENPLDWDEIKAAEYERLTQLDSLIPQLKISSDKRIAADKDFAYVREEMERYKKMMADKTVSLNEAQRLKEKQEADDRLKARKKELAARAPSPETVYDIKLKDVDVPGLPAPEKKTNTVASVEGSKNGKTSPSGTASVDPNEKAPADELNGEESTDDKVAGVDVALDEARRILADLVKLSPPSEGLAVTGPGKKSENGTANKALP